MRTNSCGRLLQILTIIGDKKDQGDWRKKDRNALILIGHLYQQQQQ